MAKLNKMSTTELKSIIERADEAYYNTGTPIMSDDEYDRILDLYQEKTGLEKGEVGHEPTTGKIVSIPYWMGSMDKIKPGTGALKRWINRYKGPYLVTAKLDGISALLIVEGDRLKLYTRGKGNIGQDISHLLPYLKLDKGEILKYNIKAIRGELIFPKSAYRKIADLGYKDARGAASSLGNADEKSYNRQLAKLVNYVVYEIIEPRYAPSRQLDKLEKLGFNVVYSQKLDVLNEEILIEIIKTYREKLQYTIDGIVIYDDHKYGRNLSGNPEYAKAFKIPGQSFITQVVRVEWHPSRRGRLDPLVIYDPVKIKMKVEEDEDETSAKEAPTITLTKATGKNAKFIVENSIGPGAIIEVSRAGDVIPDIVNVVKRADEPSLPDCCYKWSETGVDIVLDADGVGQEMKGLYSKVDIRQIHFFFATLGIKGIGEKVVERIYNAGYTDIIDFLNLTEEDLREIGFGVKSANNTYNAIQKGLNEVNLGNLMVASGAFPNSIGHKKIKIVAETYPDMLERNLTVDELVNINGLGKKTADLILVGIEKFKQFEERLPDWVTIESETDLDESDADAPMHPELEGKHIAITGFRNKDLERFLEMNLAHMQNTVNSKTDMLVVKDENVSNKKTLEAESRGIPVISVEGFWKKIKMWGNRPTRD